MGLEIDLYCNDGSPLHVIPADIYGRGVGGAELSMMSWAETMAGRGHTVRIYNNPAMGGFHAGVEYLPKDAFEPTKGRDVFIVYRSPNSVLKNTVADFKIHWSMDQHTIGRFDRDIFPFVDRVVCISPFHVAYHLEKYVVDGAKIGHIDLGVRLQDYDIDVERIPGRCIFCSIPDRGLSVLNFVWPKIKARRSDATLVITSDYTLWGSRNPGDHRYRLDFLYNPDVIYLGNVPRKQLVREQLAAEVKSYPCLYQELFCISVAECQVSGATPITSDQGSLPTTNEWGTMLPGNPLDGGWQAEFVDAVVAAIGQSEAEREAMQEKARARFNWERICAQWERLIETGEFPE
jgi:glycosyltransferase involved in cell wall biosynthesis